MQLMYVSDSAEDSVSGGSKETDVVTGIALSNFRPPHKLLVNSLPRFSLSIAFVTLNVAFGACCGTLDC
jgi:hypothetical protein